MRILLMESADAGTIADAVNRGEVYRVLVKPVDQEQLQAYIRDAYRIYESRGG